MIVILKINMLKFLNILHLWKHMWEVVLIFMQN